jgi:hypothetical protein
VVAVQEEGLLGRLEALGLAAYVGVPLDEDWRVIRWDSQAGAIMLPVASARDLVDAVADHTPWPEYAAAQNRTSSGARRGSRWAGAGGPAGLGRKIAVAGAAGPLLLGLHAAAAAAAVSAPTDGPGAGGIAAVGNAAVQPGQIAATGAESLPAVSPDLLPAGFSGFLAGPATGPAAAPGDDRAFSGTSAGSGPDAGPGPELHQSRRAGPQCPLPRRR